MRAFISTSSRSSRWLAFASLLAALELPQAFAADAPTGQREEDFSGSPFTEYGEFTDGIDEEADTVFMQYGRLFGVSVGTGISGALGNRGTLWQGGFPMLDLKVHYWFDFNLALDLNFYNASHFHDIDVDGRGHTDIYVTRLGADLKYYFDTKDLSATISFANPYILGGVGAYAKNENYANGNKDTQNSFGLSIGGGLEFVIKPRKAYFALEMKGTSVKFDTDSSPEFRNVKGIDDTTGMLYTATGSILFTW